MAIIKLDKLNDTGDVTAAAGVARGGRDDVLRLSLKNGKLTIYAMNPPFAYQRHAVSCETTDGEFDLYVPVRETLDLFRTVDGSNHEIAVDADGDLTLTRDNRLFVLAAMPRPAVAPDPLAGPIDTSSVAEISASALLERIDWLRGFLMSSSPNIKQHYLHLGEAGSGFAGDFGVMARVEGPALPSRVCLNSGGARVFSGWLNKIESDLIQLARTKDGKHLIFSQPKTDNAIAVLLHEVDVADPLDGDIEPVEEIVCEREQLLTACRYVMACGGLHAGQPLHMRITGLKTPKGAPMAALAHLEVLAPLARKPAKLSRVRIEVPRFLAADPIDFYVGSDDLVHVLTGLKTRCVFLAVSRVKGCLSIRDMVEAPPATPATVCICSALLKVRFPSAAPKPPPQDVTPATGPA